MDPFAALVLTAPFAALVAVIVRRCHLDELAHRRVRAGMPADAAAAEARRTAS